MNHKFADFYKENIEEKEYKIFCEFIEILEKNDMLNEENLLIEGLFSNMINKLKGVIKSIPEQIKEKFEFIKGLAIQLKLDFVDMLKLFKDKVVFKLFNAMKWNLKNLFLKLKKGFEVYTHLMTIIAEFIDKEGRISKWTDPLIKKLSDFIHEHPLIAWGSGIIVGSLALYLWFSTVHSGNVFHDFDLTFVLEAFLGKITFYDLLGGTPGISLLLSFVTGTFVDLSFPWTTVFGALSDLAKTTPAIAVLIAGIFVTLGKKAGVKIKEKIKYNPETEEELDSLVAEN